MIIAIGNQLINQDAVQYAEIDRNNLAIAFYFYRGEWGCRAYTYESGKELELAWKNYGDACINEVPWVELKGVNYKGFE